ncbi:MAG: hypothetical protein KGR25_10245 [Chloroflexi bacterium]|nr:hypothetical protein [Chloroflexota bacterium]
MKPFYWVEAGNPLVQSLTAQAVVGSGVQTIRATHPGEEFVIANVAHSHADAGVVAGRP